jgi:hypothetical protein
MPLQVEAPGLIPAVMLSSLLLRARGLMPPLHMSLCVCVYVWPQVAQLSGGPPCLHLQAGQWAGGGHEGVQGPHEVCMSLEAVGLK